MPAGSRASGCAPRKGMSRTDDWRSSPGTIEKRMDFRHVRLDLGADGVATLTLNRPESLNALSGAMVDELRAAVESLSGTGARCLLMTGEGRGFSSGADLASGGGLPDDVGASLENHFNPLIEAMFACPMPVIAAVNGPCAGAGMSLALACDIVIAGRSATFLQAFCNIGLVPDAGSTYFLPRLAGRARAAGLALLGERISAETACDWGLIWKVVDDAALAAEAAGIARKLAAGPTRGLALIRQALDRSWANDLAGQLGVERVAQREAGRTADFAEGVRAFLEKRPARFQGR